MDFTPSSSSTPSRDTSPYQMFFSDMENVGLDYDILNNPIYLNDFDLTGYHKDFTLFPTNKSLPQSPISNTSFFPRLESYDSPNSVDALPVRRFECQFTGCTESFQRQCELTRHEYKHTKPFSCPHCGRAFAEKRRCVQHIQSVHDLATEKDKTKCHLCKYAHVRPDAVKRHLRLKHGVGTKSKTSPSATSGSEKGTGPKRGLR